jgi:hypothetical protein
MDVRLIIVKQSILLDREACRFKCHLEAVCRFRWSLDIVKVAPMNFLNEVERVLEPCLLPASL